jgi:hypothetical protein
MCYIPQSHSSWKVRPKNFELGLHIIKFLIMEFFFSLT